MQDGFDRQVAAAPLRFVRGEMHILLVTSSAGRWILPKGRLDAGRSGPDMAAQEAMEEGGVIGIALEPSIGTYTSSRAGRMCRTEIFPLLVQRVLATWKEQDRRRRAWLPLAAGAEQIQIEPMADLVAAFAADQGRLAALHDRLRQRRTA